LAFSLRSDPDRFGANPHPTAVDQIDVANRTPATKAKMAERILRAASDGVTDPVQLTAVAVEAV
jgi:phenylpyruvate tautomerase PptA (4-oxalocrotonate tautomerase family)